MASQSSGKKDFFQGIRRENPNSYTSKYSRVFELLCRFRCQMMEAFLGSNQGGESRIF